MEGTGASGESVPTNEEKDPHLLTDRLKVSDFDWLEEIDEESKIYKLALNDIEEVLSCEEITNEHIDSLVKKLNSYKPPITKLTELASTQILAYKRALEDTNQPLELIKPELRRIKEYIEPIIQASKTTLKLIKQRMKKEE